jgi:hypothetical protein
MSIVEGEPAIPRRELARRVYGSDDDAAIKRIHTILYNLRKEGKLAAGP